MRDAPAALSHLGSPIVNDSTGLTALIFLRAYHVQGPVPATKWLAIRLLWGIRLLAKGGIFLGSRD